MDKEPKATPPGRRAFLTAAGLGVGAAAARVVGAVALDAQPAGAETISGGDAYRETAHVKRFYELAKKF